MAEILIIDDDATLCSMLSTRLASKGHTSQSALRLAEGFDLADNGNFDVILLDVQLPDGNGLEYIPSFSSVPSNPEIIIMTGNGDPEGAQKAIASGAWDYLEKPHVIRDLLLPLTRALQYRQEKNKATTIPVVLQRGGIIGNSKTINACLDQVAHAATSDAPALITGETGTGKELFAAAIHRNSKRNTGEFVVVDCAALPETLIESTLFGHVKGAFTGAEKNREGLVALADGGTLFLDEIGELSLAVQRKLLRVLQERTFRSVGSEQEKSSDFRVIAATNRNLSEMVDQGTFRNDLLFRLRSFHIELPPLREREGDISELVHSILNAFCERRLLDPKAVSSEFITCLEAYSWPGNVRELQQVLEEVFIRAQAHHTLFAVHLPDQIRIHASQSNLSSGRDTHNIAAPPTAAQPEPWKQFKATMESSYLAGLMSYCRGDIKSACSCSGLSRARIYQLLKKYPQSV